LKSNYFEAYNNKGLVLLQLEQIKEADESITQSLEINEDFFLSFFNKVCIDVSFRDYSSVTTHLEILEDIIKTIGTNLNEEN
jgi:Tfp pilus assembly protein PilF